METNKQTKGEYSWMLYNVSFEILKAKMQKYPVTACLIEESVKLGHMFIEEVIKQVDKESLKSGGLLGSNEARFEGQQRSGEKIVNCLCCKHCLPPFKRVNGQICTLTECHFEEA